MVDTGLDSSNNDLLSNILFNDNDPVDGINNDNDSLFGEPLIDNYMGWDVADWDGNVTNKAQSHGSKVAGVSSAKTNNNIGIAGVGYNTKFLPIKASPDNNPNSITHGYDGLIYAAENGCQIINLSWGSTFADTTLLQDIINYVVNDLNCIVTAAAGNSDLDEKYYPAALNNVISVTGIKGNLEKQGRSTYNYSVDLCAVGQFVRTTFPNNQFKVESGTSMATPVVSGALALLKSQLPTWTSKQITEQLLVTAKVIDTIGTNINYQHKLGKMINVEKALTDTLNPSIRTTSLGIPYPLEFNNTGQKIIFSPTFINYLKPTSDIKVTLEILEGNAFLNDSTIHINSINTFETFNHQDSIFSFTILPSNELIEYIVLKINYENSSYNNYDIFELYFTPSLPTNFEGLNETKNSHLLNIFPNPIDNQININSNLEFNSIKIYNELGKLIMLENLDYKVKKHKIKNPKLEKGIFIIEVSDGKKSITSKILKK